MWEQCKDTVDKALQEVKPLQRIEQNPWFPFKPEHHFHKIIYSIVIVCHTMWIINGFYRTMSLFTTDVSQLEIHEVAIVFFCRVIGFMLQLCGMLYFIQRLLGRESTALVESVTKNYSYVQLFNVAASAPFLVIGIGVNLVKYNSKALVARVLQLFAGITYSIVHLLVCDIFLSWPDDQSQGSGATPATPSMDNIPSPDGAKAGLKEMDGSRGL